MFHQLGASSHWSPDQDCRRRSDGPKFQFVEALTDWLATEIADWGTPTTDSAARPGPSKGRTGQKPCSGAGVIGLIGWPTRVATATQRL